MRTVTHSLCSHHPSSPASVRALAVLRSALSAPYPADKPQAPPLEFNLEVVESVPPTPDQLRTILSFITPKNASSQSYSAFLSAHPSTPSPSPSTPSGISALAGENLNVLKWPIVVDWNGGRASVGDVESVKSILEALRQRRDSEVNDEDA